MEWQPIETAPKDGTRILAWPWITNGQEKGGKKHLVAVIMWAGGDSQFGYWRGTFAHHKDGFTHWMPLPEPPQSPKVR